MSDICNPVPVTNFKYWFGYKVENEDIFISSNNMISFDNNNSITSQFISSKQFKIKHNINKNISFYIIKTTNNTLKNDVYSVMDKYIHYGIDYKDSNNVISVDTFSLFSRNMNNIFNILQNNIGLENENENKNENENENDTNLDTQQKEEPSIYNYDIRILSDTSNKNILNIRTYITNENIRDKTLMFLLPFCVFLHINNN